MKLPYNSDSFHSEEGKRAKEIIDRLRKMAFSDTGDLTNVFACKEILNIALLATSALKEITEEMPWEYHEITPTVPAWPVLYGKGFDAAHYDSLKIGHQLLASKNPDKRVDNGLFNFFGRALVSRLYILSIRAHFGESTESVDKFTERINLTHSAQATEELDAKFAKEHIIELQKKIAAYTPEWAETTKTLEDFNENTAENWRKLGSKLFKEVVRNPEQVPELRKLIGDDDAKGQDSVIRARIVARVGRAIISISGGIDPDL